MTAQQTLRDQNRLALAAAGARELERSSVKALRSVLTPSALARPANVSRDTAYRVFKPSGPEDPEVTDALIEAIANEVMEPRLDGFFAAEEARRAPDSGSSRLGPDAEHLVRFLTGMIEAQFTSDGYCARLFLHASALPASRQFQRVDLADEDRWLAERILRLRSDAYGVMKVGIVHMLRVGLSDLGRRPRNGVSLDQIAAMLHALLDGSVLRMSIDPDLLAARDVAEAMLDLAVAMTEPGGVRDPRRPDGVATAALFDHVVKTAIDAWQLRGPETSLTLDEIFQIAEEQHPGTAVARDCLPTLADVADSALRLVVDAGGQFSQIESNYEQRPPEIRADWSEDVAGRLTDWAGQTDQPEELGTILTDFDLGTSPPSVPDAHRQGALTALTQALDRLCAQRASLPVALRILETSRPQLGSTLIEDLKVGAARILADPALPDPEVAAARADSLADLLIDAALDGSQRTVHRLMMSAGYGLTPHPQAEVMP